MIESILMADESEVPAIVRALDSELRRSMLNILSRKPMNVKQLSGELGIPQSTCVVNLQILEKARIIRTEQTAAVKGSQKICSLAYKEVVLPLLSEPPVDDRSTVTIEMPIGLYTDYEVAAPCGLANAQQVIGYFDMTDSLLDPRRAGAGLIWLSSGHLDYRFPKTNHPDTRIRSVTISAEVCSEYPGSRMPWPSDITLWINNHEIGTWTCPGDMGGIPGRFTPQWWPVTDSQYGFLKTWKVTREGSFVDGVPTTATNIHDILTPKSDSYNVRIGVKPDAVYRGGMNLFGRSFGNYEQDIILRIELEKIEPESGT